MRILIANEALVGSGGVESYLATLLPALMRRGHDVALLHANTRHENGGTRLDRSNLATFGVADEGDAALARALEWAPDLCFSHNLRQLDIEERLLAARPVVKMMHGYFGTCVSAQKAHAWPHVVPCTRAFGQACLALYMPRHCGQYRPLKMVEQYRWTRRQEQLLSRYASIVVASRHMADEYRRQGVDEERLTVAPLFSTIRPPVPPRERPSIPAVLFAGRMTAVKGGEVLVRAIAVASRHVSSPVRLIMAGDGPERTRLEALAASLEVDATFTGWIEGDARESVFRRATLVGVPSLWPEPFGLSGLDAASYGIPAIAFDVGGIREWLRDGMNGILVEPRGGADALGRAIAAVLSRGDELTRLEEGALDAAREHSIDAHLDALEPVFSRARHGAGTFLGAKRCGEALTSASDRRLHRPAAAQRRTPGATFHLVTGEYPPAGGGVGDYTALLAAALTQRGIDVHVWTPRADALVAVDGVRLHELPDRFGRAARRRLEQELSSIPGSMLLQYVPNVLGSRGANLAFCLWLLRMSRQGLDVRVMFHEPYFYFSLGRPLGNGLALAQRVMAALVLRAARVVYLSTDTWLRYLEPYAPRGTAWKTLPVPSTVPAGVDDLSTVRWRARGLAENGHRLIGHFGTFGADMARPLELLVPALLSGDRDLHFLCMGRNSDAFVAAVGSRHPQLRDRLHGAGALAAAELAGALKACDLLIQPYPDGVTTRRTSVMAGLANGVATVTTSGALTESMWAATRAVALAPASDVKALAHEVASLLADDDARRQLAANGHRVYQERFAMEHTVRELLED